jgi:hypothetical protein
LTPSVCVVLSPNTSSWRWAPAGVMNSATTGIGAPGTGPACTLLSGGGCGSIGLPQSGVATRNGCLRKHSTTVLPGPGVPNTSSLGALPVSSPAAIEPRVSHAVFCGA